MASKWTDRVKAKLKADGLVYNDLAEVLNVTEGAVSHYLNGAREPSINQVKEIAKMIDMSLSELLGDDAVFITNLKEIKAAELIQQMPEEKKDLALKLLATLAENEEQ